MKHFLKLTLPLLSIFNYAKPSVTKAVSIPTYSQEAVFLTGNEADIIQEANIKTTEGPIKISKFKGKIISNIGTITSADDIELSEVSASMSAKKNITAAGDINLAEKKTSLNSSNGSISATKNIILGDDTISLKARNSITSSTGSITIDGNSCILSATKGKIATDKNISITTNGTDSSIFAEGNITCDLTISASATNSSITSNGNIFAGAGIGSGNKVIAWGSGSTITAKKTIIADVVEANKIICNTLVTHTKNRSADGSIRTTRNSAGGTITADTIIANKISAGTITTTKPSQTVSESTLALALSPLLNAIK